MSQAPSQYGGASQYSAPSSMGPKQEAQAYPQQGQLQLPRTFQFGLFDCFSPFSTCCLTCWCPCITYGRIKARGRGDGDASGINGQCALYTALMCCGVSCILQMVNRSAMREKYGMESNGFGDCMTACCCPCCELIQEDKEMVVRHSGMDPRSNQAYVPPQGMTYP